MEPSRPGSTRYGYTDGRGNRRDRSNDTREAQNVVGRGASRYGVVIERESAARPDNDRRRSRSRGRRSRSREPHRSQRKYEKASRSRSRKRSLSRQSGDRKRRRSPSTSSTYSSYSGSGSLVSCSTCSGYYTRSSSLSSRSRSRSRSRGARLRIRQVDSSNDRRPRDPRSRSHRFTAPDLTETRLQVKSRKFYFAHIFFRLTVIGCILR